MQQEQLHGTASEVLVQPRHVGLGGYAPNEEDTEMPDIMREKFPAGSAVIGMVALQHVNCLVIFRSFAS